MLENEHENVKIHWKIVLSFPRIKNPHVSLVLNIKNRWVMWFVCGKSNEYNTNARGFFRVQNKVKRTELFENFKIKFLLTEITGSENYFSKIIFL